MFESLQKESFDEREKRVLGFWLENKIFEQSIEQRKKSPHFSFFDGPPFATGLPHYGHFLAGTIKDVVLRYKTMKGFYAPRRFGWDCHGLPIEYEVEKSKGLSGAKSIEEFGVANFNEACRSIVLRYTSEWKDQVIRMGRWVDFSKTWHTM
ncbi:MAG TPA: class I tRNA ligase family protein, partial [Waddliaceae bacterium]